MPAPQAGELTTPQLATQAEQAIRILNHRARRSSGGLNDPVDVADVIAALAHMAGMLPQLLSQLTDWLGHEHRAGHLRVDSHAPHPEINLTLGILTETLQNAIEVQRQAAHHLDTAHQHAAHIASVDPVPQQPPPHYRGQNSCRSVGPNHLTKRIERMSSHFQSCRPPLR